MYDGPLTVENISEGMPDHPAFEGRPVMWLTQGDTWWFRRITTVLIPKSVPDYVKTMPEVRYVVCAIRHHEEDFDDGFDFTMWMQVETKDRQGNTVKINSALCLPPSYVVGEDRLEKAVSSVSEAFDQVYTEHKWITQFPMIASVTEIMPHEHEDELLPAPPDELIIDAEGLHQDVP
jgi:hypothetical protein